MRLFVSGSAPLLEATFADFEAKTGHRILERYGMTEAGMICSNPYDGERIPGTVGFPLPGVEARIRDEVLEIRGPNLFKGYWRNPEKTAEEMRADGFFITGDIATMAADGRVAIVGRAKDLIIAGGLNIYPKEIELAIDAVPGVGESAVIGVPHPDLGEARGRGGRPQPIRRSTRRRCSPASPTSPASSSRAGSSSPTRCRATRWARCRRRRCARRTRDLFAA